LATQNPIAQRVADGGAVILFLLAHSHL
jgi:hypothetical protein